MAELTSPFGKAVIDVPEASVDRYVEAGWKRKAGPKKAPAKKTSAKADDDK